MLADWLVLVALCAPAFLAAPGLNQGGLNQDVLTRVSLDREASPLVKALVKPGEVTAKSVPGLPAGPKERNFPWVWLDQTETMAACFRTTLELKAKPRSAIFDVTAETSYQLFVNGQLVCRGPADIGRDYDTGPLGPWLFDRRELAPYLHNGPNIIALRVFARPLASNQAQTGHPGFGLIVSQNGKPLDLAWRGIPDPAFQTTKPNAGQPLAGSEVLTFDGNAEPIGWTSEGFNDVSWPPAKQGPIYRHAELSELPPALEVPYPLTKIERPHGGVDANLEVNSAGGYAATFDRVLSAYPGLHLQGVKGTIVTLIPSELPDQGPSRPIRWILRDGEQWLQSPVLDSFATLKVEFSNVTGPAKVLETRALFSSYPVRYLGAFECSDPKLTKLWNVGRWATQICLQTHHLDSPNHQEPICDPGDYLIETLVEAQTFGDLRLTRQDLRKYAHLINARKGHVFHTSYALLWLQMLLAYYRYSGDEALITELAPTAHHLLDVWRGWVGTNGLVSEAPNYMFMDWVNVDGFNLHHPPAVIGQGYMSALYYRALEDDAAIATLLGDRSRVRQATRDRAALKTAFQRELWSPKDGLYRDGKPFQTHVKPGPWLPEDKPIETFTTQVNTLAVASGLTSKARGAEIMRKLLARPDMNCQPYFMHFVFDALEACGLYNSAALAQMRRWQVVPQTQSLREMWHDGDYSHAWGASPTYQLSARVLGVRPASPGFKAIEIRPNPGDLRWAKGSVPTPKGPIEVSWQNPPDGRFGFSVRAPDGVACRLYLPGSAKPIDFIGRISTGTDHD
jgi:hypothetical protein